MLHLAAKAPCLRAPLSSNVRPLNMNQLTRLTEWYGKQCNGEWEHSFGVHVETLDNPGWLVKVDLTGTPLEHRPYSPFERGEPDTGANWLSCKIENKQFIGAGGARDLEAVLEAFLSWAEL